MTTLARLSFQVSLERRDSVESLYEGQLAPILERHGLVATTAPGRPAATETNPHGYWICSRLFAVDSPELIPGYDQALREDPAWQQAVRLPIHTYRLDVYQTPAGPGKTVPSGPGQASSAGPGTPVEVGSGFRLVMF